MGERNKSVTEILMDDPQAAYNLRKSREIAHNEGIQDARAWRDHWRARAAEEQMQDEGDLYAPRPLFDLRVLVKAGIVALIVYALITAALVLLP